MSWITNLAAKLHRPPLWLTLAGCAAILVARRPDCFLNPQFWAEDGTLFFLQAHVDGSRAILQPYAGYLHTVLRLAAWLASAFDPALIPALYVAAAFILTLYVAARTQSPRFPLPPSPVYALAVVLVPDAFEVLLTLTNLQWVLAGGLLLVLIAREPERPRQRWHDLGAVLLLGLTGPFVIVLLPLFVWRAWQRRTRFSTGLAAMAGIAACIQFSFIVRAVASAGTQAAAQFVLPIVGVRLGGSLLSGGNWNAGIGLAWAGVLGVLTLLGVAWLSGRPGQARIERRMLGVAFAGVLVVVLYRCRHVLPGLFHGTGARYFFPLQLILIWLVVAAVREARAWRAGLAWALVAALAALNVPRWREPAFQDRNWPEFAARIRRHERVAAPINPDWEVNVPGHEATGAQRGPSERGTFVNISMRCRVARGHPAMAGFALRTTTARTFLIRVVGPSLGQFGVSPTVLRPKVTLLREGLEDPGFRPSDNGTEDPRLRRVVEACRAFALQPGAADLAGLVTLESGVYSVVVSTEEETGGEALLEVYEVPEGLTVG